MSFIPVRHIKAFNKYGAKKVWVCAICEVYTRSEKPAPGDKCAACNEGNWLRFDSKREHKYWTDFRQLERRGDIRNLTLQPKFPIVINGEKVCSYIADFSFFEGNRRRVLDVKGVMTPMFKLKRKLVTAVYPGVEIEVVR